MQHLSHSPLTAWPTFLDDPAIIGAAEAWSWRQVHEASISLAERLNDAGAVCNLCTTRVGFLITWLAALRRRCVLVLPPSSGLGDLTRVLAANPRTIVVGDDIEHLRKNLPEDAHWVHCTPPEQRQSWADNETFGLQPDWAGTAVVLYTSGSTGTPEPQAKTLMELAEGAVALGARLAESLDGGLRAIRRIVCSVPPQHMFGVESSVMLSLLHNIPVLDDRPLLPADVAQVFADSPASAWIATPLHLRGLAESGVRLRHCAVVVASTMPLTRALAWQTESLVDAPVLEIYGSTETGALAMRRTAQTTAWRPLGGVQLESIDGATRAKGVHFRSPVELFDQIAIAPDGCFELLGRQSDMVKIAGRRASLAGLNLVLQDLPHLDDGVLYLPDSNAPVQRLCLIYAGTALDRAAAEQWLKSRMDAAFIPRTFIRVDRLPRNDNGKLPRQALNDVFEAWQRRKVATVGAPVPFEFGIPPEHPALAGHFPGRPIVPGVLLLAHVLEHASRALRSRVTTLRHAKFSSPMLPGETATVVFGSKNGVIDFRAQVERAGTVVVIASGALSVASPGAPR